jgi:hypothetical protein
VVEALGLLLVELETILEVVAFLQVEVGEPIQHQVVLTMQLVALVDKV